MRSHQSCPQFSVARTCKLPLLLSARALWLVTLSGEKWLQTWHEEVCGTKFGLVDVLVVSELTCQS